MPYCTSGCRSGLASPTLQPPTLLMRERSGLRVLCFDVQGVTQGPCSITEFRGWMQDLRSNPQLSLQYKQFSEVVAWRVCTMLSSCLCVSHCVCIYQCASGVTQEMWHTHLLLLDLEVQLQCK